MDNSVGRLISILYRKNQAYLNSAFKPYDLTSSEHPVLMYLYRTNAVTQEEIANYLLIDKASMTRTIQSLLSKGYIIKEKDQYDKRCNKISLTEKGFSVRNGITEKLNEWNDYLMSELNEEQKTLVFSSLLELVEKVETSDFKEWKTNDRNSESSGD